MKSLILILATVTGMELKTVPLDPRLTCFEAGDKIIQNIGIYYEERNGDPKQQGYYMKNGKLIMGFYCK